MSTCNNCVWIINTQEISLTSRIRKAFKCHCGKSYKTSLKLRNHTLLIHSGSTGGSTSDLSSSSLSSLNSTTQQLSDSASSPLSGLTLKNSINLVAIKSSKSSSISNGASTSKGNTKENNGKHNGDAVGNKIPKLTPMKGNELVYSIYIN